MADFRAKTVLFWVFLFVFFGGDVFAFYLGMVEDNLLLSYVLCRQPKTKFSKLISFAIEENIWGPIFLATNDSIREKDPQKAKFYWLQKN